MRGRHLPRLCRSCGAPMARQEDNCWHCEAVWDDRSPGRGSRLAVRGGNGARSSEGDQAIASADMGDAGTVAPARLARHRLGGAGGHPAAQRSGRVGAQVVAVQ